MFDIPENVPLQREPLRELLELVSEPSSNYYWTYLRDFGLKSTGDFFSNLFLPNSGAEGQRIDIHRLKASHLDTKTFSGLAENTFEDYHDLLGLIICINTSSRLQIQCTWSNFLQIIAETNAPAQILDLLRPVQLGTGVGDIRTSGDGRICISVWHCNVDDTRSRKTVPVRHFAGDRCVVSFDYNYALPLQKWLFIAPHHVVNPLLGLVSSIERRSEDSDKRDALSCETVGLTTLVLLATHNWQIALDSAEEDLIHLKDVIANTAESLGRLDRSASLLPRLEAHSISIDDFRTKLEANEFALAALRRAFVAQGIDTSSLVMVEKALDTIRRRLLRIKHLRDQIRLLKAKLTDRDSTLHAYRMETFTWYNLKVSSTVEMAVKQGLILICIFIPGIFVSTLFSSVFFDLRESGNIYATQNLWIWFVVTIPLAILILSTIMWWTTYKAKLAVMRNRPLVPRSKADSEVELGTVA